MIPQKIECLLQFEPLTSMGFRKDKALHCKYPTKRKSLEIPPHGPEFIVSQRHICSIYRWIFIFLTWQFCKLNLTSGWIFFFIQASSPVIKVFLPWIHLCNSISLHQGYMCATEVIYGKQLGWRDLMVDTNWPLEYLLLLMMWKKPKRGEFSKQAKPSTIFFL